MFKVSSFVRTQALIKSFAPLMTCWQSTVQGRTKLQSASASVRRWCGFSSGIHDAAWQPRSGNQLDWDLDCLDFGGHKSGEMKSGVSRRRTPQFHANIHTSVSFTRQCSNKVKLRWEIFHSCFFLIPTLKEFKKSTNSCQSYSKNKSGPVFLTHSVYCCDYKFSHITREHHSFLLVLDSRDQTNPRHASSLLK